MEKAEIIRQIQAHLAESFRALLPLAEAAGAGGARLTEQSAQRIREIRQQLTMYQYFPVTRYGKDDVICPSALVELELGTRRAFYFVVPAGGGLVMKVDGHPLQVITPQSPLGEALLGRRVGDRVRVQAQGSPREYRVVSLA